MPIFVEHKETHDLFVLISGGFGAYRSAAVNDSGVNQVEKGTYALVCVCDKKGNIGWLESSKVRVIHVDGTDIADLQDLGEFDESTL